MSVKKVIGLATAALLVLTVAPAAAQAVHTAEDAVVTNPGDGTTIAITVFKPATASSTSLAPVVLHSHGWAGSRETAIDSDEVLPFLDAGMGVVSIDQRGHGESSGEAYTQDPTRETEDIQAVIDYIAGLDWVRLDGPNDPVLAAIGGSYGGGYQTMTALDEIAENGSTRFNALAPQITWYDLPQSLAPQRVPRSLWNILLYAVGAQMLPQDVHEAFAYGTATGQWPDGTIYGQPAPGVIPNLHGRFHRNSPVSFVEEGVQIDVPVLVRQGITDTLFTLNQGIEIFDLAVNDEARSQSYLVGYNGGHVLPQAYPSGLSGGDDACSPEGFTQLTIDFFTRVFAGQSTDGLMPARYNLTTAEGEGCLRMDEFDTDRKLGADLLGAGTTVTVAGAAPPVQIPIAEGPVTIAGIPNLTGRVTAVGPLETRTFFGLSTGTDATDALLIQNQVMPLRELRTPVDKPFDVDLAGVAIEVPEGQTLFLTITPVADAFAFHGTKPAGTMVFSDLSLMLPEPAEIVPQLKDSLLTLVAPSKGPKGAKRVLTATLTDAETGLGIPGAAIAFSVDGAPLEEAVTSEQGVATLEIPPRYYGGHHHFEGTFSGNESYRGTAGSTDT